MTTKIINYLDELFPNPRCELNYSKDYELLITVMLSAQTTDKRVNMVTDILFKRYPSLELLMQADINDIINIIRPIGTYNKKAQNIKIIATRLVLDCNGIVPNNRAYLESLSGVGRKTTNVVLANLYNEPAIAVDTHMIRVSNRLGIVSVLDPVKIEKVLMQKIPKDKWNRVNEQMLLFGRYICKSKKPDCDKCPFNCKERKK